MSTLQLVGIAIIVVGAIVLFWALKNQKKSANAQSLATLALLVVVAGAVTLGSSAFFHPEVTQLQNKMESYINSKNDKFIQIVKEKYAGKKVVVIAASNQQDATNPESANLTKFLQETGASVEYLDLKDPKDPNIIRDPHVVATNATISPLLRKHQDADVFVMFCPMPFDTGDFSKLVKGTPKASFILWAEVPNAQILPDFIRKGNIAAAVMTNPKLDYEKMQNESLPDNPEDIFNAQWILLDSASIDSIVKNNPDRFPTVKKGKK